MTEIIFLIEETVEGGFTARALGESIFAEGETFEETKRNIKEAAKLIRFHTVKEEVILA